MKINGPFALLGGSGFAIEVLDYLKSQDLDVEGYFSPTPNSILSSHIQWLGIESTEPNRNLNYVIASGTPRIRRKMIEYVRLHHLATPAIISPESYISNFASIGEGTIVCPMACVTGNANIGPFCVLNTGSSIHHDCVIGENVVLAPGARIAGFAKVDNDCLLNLNSCLIPHISVAGGVELGVLSYASRNISESVTLFSPPARTLPTARPESDSSATH